MSERTRIICKRVGIAALAVATVYLFVTYLFQPLLPFLIAWALAAISQPLARLLNDKLKLPGKVSRFVATLIIFAIIGTALFALTNRLVFELNHLLRSARIETAVQEVVEFIKNIDGRMSGFDIFAEGSTFYEIGLQLEDAAVTIVTNFGVYLTDNIPTFVSWVLRIVPGTVIFSIILIVLSFYVSIDYVRLNRFVALQVPENAREFLSKVKSNFFGGVGKYVKAYGKIMSVTFCELLVGFLIIGIGSPLLLAAVIALIDVLPVIGTGGFLVPWSIVCFIRGDMFTGFALLILYAVIFVVRQIIEPRFVGRSVGVPPFIILTAVYAGFKLFGAVGVVMLPLTVITLKLLNDDGTLKLWKTPEPEIKPEKKRWFGRKIK